MGMNLRPSTYTEGGGLPDDLDVTVKESAFVMYDFNGSVIPAVCCLGMTLTFADADGKEAEQQDYLSLGTHGNWKPSDDGKQANPDGSAGDYAIQPENKNLNRNCKLAKFLESLVNSGYPEDKLDNFSASSLVGLGFHLKREAVKYTGLVRTGKNAGREQTALTANKIHKMPWEKAAAVSPLAKKAGLGGKPAPSSNATSAFTSAPSKVNGKGEASPEQTAKAQEQVQVCLMEAGGTMAKGKLASAVFAALKGDPDQKVISQLVFKDTFLNAIDGVTFDGATLTMG
jgi:hypothetical protein